MRKLLSSPFNANTANAQSGLYIEGPDCSIGGADGRLVVTGNNRGIAPLSRHAGIAVLGRNATISNVLVGLEADGVTGHGNGYAGIFVGGTAGSASIGAAGVDNRVVVCAALFCSALLGIACSEREPLRIALV